MNACVGAFNELIASSPASFPRHGNFENIAPNPKKRRHSDTEPAASTLKALKPKPAENGEQGGAFRSSSGNAPKKRGRPSKEELAQRQAEALARGEVYPPPKPQRKSTGGLQAPLAPTMMFAEDVAAGPSSEKVQTPEAGMTATGSDPPKKKRGRPTKAESAARAVS
jgi:hypothetical protein